MSANESNWPAWVRKADEDSLNIRNNLAAQEIPWSTVCFHAQQAAEKMLKAFQPFRGCPPPRIHDLVSLLAACQDFDASLTEIGSDCELLSPFAVGVRYPFDAAEPGEAQGRAAVLAAERVYAAILRRLGRGG